MLPHKLYLENFISYQSAEIDFDRLLSNGLALISGNTGAGKSTIFKAIQFALYGADAGKLAEFIHTGKDSLLVRFEFSVPARGGGGREYYTVERKVKKPSNQKALLYRGRMDSAKSDLIAIKPEVVDNEIIKLVGLNYNEFVQVVMLKQNQFSKLIKELKPSERRDVFVNLFELKHLQKAVEELSKSIKELTKEHQTLEEQFTSILNELGAKTVKEAQQKYNDEYKKLQVLQNTIAKSEEHFREISELYKKIEDKEAQTQKIVEELHQLNKQLADVSRESAELKRKLEEVRKNFEESKKLKEERVPKLEQLIQAKESFDKLKKQQSELSLSISRLSGESKKLKEEQIGADDELAKLKQQIKLLEESVAKYSGAEQTLFELKEKHKSATELVNLIEEQTVKQTELSKLKKQEQLLNAKFEEAKKLKKLHIASELAAELQDGEPCPVCGSTHHPAPAKQVVDEVNIEELQTERENLIKEISSVETDINNRREAINKKVSELGINQVDLTSVKRFVDRLEQELKQVEAQVERLKADNSKLSELRKREDSLNTHLKKLNQKILELSQKISEQKGKLDNLTYQIQDTLNRFSQEILNVDTAKLKEELNDIKERYRKLSEENDNLQAQVAENEKKIADKSGRIDTLNKRYTELKEELDKMYTQFSSALVNSGRFEESIVNYVTNNWDKIKSELEHWKYELEEQRINLNRLNQEFGALKEKLTNLKKIKSERDTLAKDIDRLQKIIDVFAGKNPSKVSFVNFVLLNLIQRIVERANKYFTEMLSGAAYQLVVPSNIEEVSGSELKIEFQILDLVKNEVRNIKTLSGGETFIASLSLALGLSDIVRSAAGKNAETEVMFIDEGFGSLDQESTLAEVVKQIALLCKDGRKICIISHVEMLKHHVPFHLYVFKDASKGSQVRFM